VVGAWGFHGLAPVALINRRFAAPDHRPRSDPMAARVAPLRDVVFLCGVSALSAFSAVSFSA